jgi:hypothetical protein
MFPTLLRKLLIVELVLIAGVAWICFHCDHILVHTKILCRFSQLPILCADSKRPDLF